MRRDAPYRAAVKREFDGLKALYDDYLTALRNAYPLPTVAEPTRKPSTRTSVRLAPDADIPRRVTPCVVGFATRDDVRRNRLKPGTDRS